MRTLLICHEDDILNREGLARWLASFSTLSGVVVLREPPSRLRRRWRREITRVGVLRFLDVVAFRLHYSLFQASVDRQWTERCMVGLRAQFPASTAPELISESPNSAEVERFIRQSAPDLVIARCKTLLAPRIFTIPPQGTFVMHPGICPQYRNAHGCFWALAHGDTGNVGMTLLRIDEGVDTGPVYGWFRYQGDEALDSHIVIQHRVVFDHLDAIAARLRAIVGGQASPETTAGLPSATWGQPWLTAYWRWKRRASRSKA